jgi:hypothetical protein
MTHGLAIDRLYRHPKYGIVRVKDVVGDATFIEYYVFNTTGVRITPNFKSVNHKHLVIHDTIVGETMYDVNTMKSVVILDEIGNTITVRDKQDREYIVDFCCLVPTYRECVETNLQNKSRNEEIVKLLKKGSRLSDLANRFSLDVSVVQTIARSFGLELNTKLSDESRDRIKQAKSFVNTLSYDEIKAKFSLTDDVMVMSGLKDKLERQKEVAKILAMYKENYTLKEIADFFDCCSDRISKIIRVNNAYKIPSLKMSIADKKKFSDNIKSIITEKFNTGLSDDDIAYDMNEEGHKTLFGTEFTATHVRKITKDIPVNKPVKKVVVKEKDYLSLYIKSKRVKA